MKFAIAVLLILAYTLVLPSSGIAQSSFPGTMNLRKGKLTARIIAAPLLQVLEEISQLSGIRIVWLNGAESNRQVSAEFTDLPMVEGLMKILAQTNFLFFYTSAADDARLTQIWISSTGGGQALWRSPSLLSKSNLPATEEEGHNGEDPLLDLSVDQLIHLAMYDQDPSSRENAITYLQTRSHEDPRVFGTLAHIAQNDMNAQVQAAAAEALQQMEEEGV
jgi:hypothetical protein